MGVVGVDSQLFCADNTCGHFKYPDYVDSIFFPQF